MGWQWNEERAAGVILHISSLPGSAGIGNFGETAYRFIDFLSSAGMHYWQVCPLGPTGYGDSPYQPIASFALNPYFIDYEAIGTAPPVSSNAAVVNFCGWYQWLQEQIPFFGTTLYERIRKKETFQSFLKHHHYWLENYAKFAALKYHFNGQEWHQWDPIFWNKSCALPESLTSVFNGYLALQYTAHEQWFRLKKYANDHQVQIIGDLPMFPGYDSADVWANPQNFQLNRQRCPQYVAGVPPDYFSSTGQLWGNPVYDWAFLKSDHYRWWHQRLERNFELFDIVRLDHFRGLDRFWKIPANASDAIRGNWAKAHGTEVLRPFLNQPMIAEDLGDIDASAAQLKAKFRLPGMSVLQFAFSGDPKNHYLPHNLERHNVLYLGTHDNDTLLGWYQHCDEATRDQVRQYFGIDDTQLTWKWVTEAYRAPCFLAMLSVQDLLKLSSEARLNTPGTIGRNWQWRMTPEQFDQLIALTPELRTYQQRYDR
ncbi:MAG: 4-alpha-glucanotransferase [Opitutales bacterium]|nr:4-alpha-glucanotransferase [Opitutales bacterium]